MAQVTEEKPPKYLKLNREDHDRVLAWFPTQHVFALKLSLVILAILFSLFVVGVCIHIIKKVTR